MLLMAKSDERNDARAEEAQRRIETARQSILRKLKIFPIVSWTQLTSIVQTGIELNELRVLLYKLEGEGLITYIPRPMGSTLADRYCLTENVEALAPFVNPNLDDALRFYADEYRDIIRAFMRFPIMTPSLLATATNSTAHFGAKRRNDLLREKILAVYHPPEHLRMRERYYLARYEEVLRPFLRDGEQTAEEAAS